LEMQGLRAGGRVLAALIKPRIDQVHWDFIPGDDGLPLDILQARHLWEVIYCHLATGWKGKTGYYQCEYRTCDKWWLTDDEKVGRKRKFCPPEGGKGESFCSMRERYHRKGDP
ncbi:MAG: hypothetical protein ACE5Q6_24960, partial [Dehalococcoidia bacterium]